MKKIITLLLILAVISSAVALCTTGSTAQEEQKPYEAIAQYSDKASVLISKTDFERASASGMIKSYQIFDGMAYTPTTVPESDNMVFTKAVKYACVTPPASWINTAVKINFDTASSAYKSMKVGDTLLLKFTARGFEGECDLSIRLWNAADQNYNLINQGARMALTDNWMSYYFPMTITDSTLIPNQLIFKMNNKAQAMLFADLELISYGTAVTKDQLASALKGAGASEVYDKTCPYYTSEPEYKVTDDGDDDNDETEGTEKAMITPEGFLKDAAIIGSNGTISKSAVSSADAEKFGLGFTDTLKVSCNKSASITSFGVSCNVASDAVETKSGDVVNLTFYARAKSANTTVKASIISKTGTVLTNVKGENGDKTEYTYYIPTQWTKIVLPVTVSGEVGGIKLYMGSSVSEVEFGGVSLDVLEEGTDAFELPAGYFLCEPYTRLVLNYEYNNYVDYGMVQKCNDIRVHENYIYAIGGGSLYIISAETEKVVGSVGGMGETRQIAINEDATTAVITSRVDGAFVIAMDDKTKPEIVGRCDTVEYATGVAVGNNYCYITNRMLGTEVIDISDRTLPKNVANIRTGEAQSCEIVGTMLFAGCWGERRVEVWDVSQPTKPVLLNKSIPAHGKGDGLCVMDNYLFIATGHMETSQAGKGLYNVGYGLGNGMDIYDISDIQNPVFLSTVRIDDHFYTNGQDFWTVKVAKKGNKTYAYMVNTFNGVYVYDVTDPKAPIRKAAIELAVYASKNQTKYNSLLNAYGHNQDSKKSYFPYDTYERHNTPVGGVAVVDGKMFIAGVNFGVAKINTSHVGDILYAQHREAGDKAPERPNSNFYALDYTALEDAGFKEIKYAVPGGQVYSVDEKNGLLYTACGNQGIKILDTDLNIVKEYPVKGTTIVSEAVVFGNRLYTAEGLGGVAIYEISEDGLGLREISRFATDRSNKFIRVSPDGRFVVADYGSSGSRLIDFSDLSNPKKWNGEGAVNNGNNSHSGLVYFRQISTGLVGGRYLCASAYNAQTYWYDFGESPETDEPRLMYTVRYGNCGMKGTFAALEGKNYGYAIGVSDGKYFVFDPADGDDTTDYSKLTMHYYTGSSSTVAGKPTIYGDLMLLADRISGKVSIIDISGIDVKNNQFDAKYITGFTFTGNPDLAKVIDNRLVLPLGNQGILSVSLDELSDNYSTKLSFRTAREEGTAPDAEKLGKATLYNKAGDEVAIFFEKATDSNTLEYTAYVPKGEYELVYEKKGYVTYREAVSVEGTTELDEITLTPGNVTGNDSVVSINDIIKVLQGFSATDNETKLLADINEDGNVNVVDLMFVIRGMKVSA
ncbi:MAG: hypothetical protein IKU43_00080 [Clostridia bacterium]|nr:hypothetical protein [Clostridia bacterium]